jgi:arylsulfatase
MGWIIDSQGAKDMAKSTKTKQPNILIMWGDDIGQSNLSCYTKGMMGYKTPN